MARSRLELRDELRKLTENLYYQQPPASGIKYPCIIYRRSGGVTLTADNLPYLTYRTYQIQVIDKDPDSKITECLEAKTDFEGNRLKIPHISNLQNHYTQYDLNYDIFSINF